VLLGIAGAAFLELAKAVLGFAFSALPQVDADVYATVIYGLIFVVALMLAGLAVQASPTGFVLYAFPIAVFAIVLTLLLLLVVTFMGWFGAYEPRDTRPLWRGVAMFGASLLLIAAVDLFKRQYGPLGRTVAVRIRPLMQSLTSRPTRALGIIGIILLILGLLFGR
jgi:hypothetical protein